MNATINCTRVELNLTEAEALQLIAKLSAALSHQKKHKAGAWFADSLTIENKCQSYAGRLTVRIED